MLFQGIPLAAALETPHPKRATRNGEEPSDPGKLQVKPNVNVISLTVVCGVQHSCFVDRLGGG